MKLITKELEERFTEVGDQSENENPTFVTKYFNPCGSQTWYASEYDSKTKICYGYVTGMFEDEWGTFSITELEAIKLPFGMKIERDLYFKEKTFNEVIHKNRFKELDTQIDKTKNHDHDIER